MIKIILDNDNLLNQTEGNQVVIDYSDYTLVYLKLLTGSIKRNNFNLLVRNKTIYHWLYNMSQRFPEGSFIFETVDARGVLKQLWGTDIPASVTNEDILQVDLLKSDLRPHPGYNFEDTLLAHFYTPIFTSKTFPFTQLAAIYERINPDQLKANLAVPLLARTLHGRLEEWKNKSHSTEQRQLVELLAVNTTEI